MTPKVTDLDFPVSVQEFPAEAWAAAGVGALSAGVHAWDLLKNRYLH